MDDLRQQRKPIRTSFTRTVNALTEVLAAQVPDVERVRSLLDQLEDKGGKLADLDAAIFKRLQDDGCTQDEYDKEFEAADTYTDRLIECKGRAKRYLATLEEDRVSIASHRSVEPHIGFRKFRLPEIEFKKFGGDLREWLGFWGQFRKIDEDHDLVPEDKYQATVAGSRAREIVESFPLSGENYAKAIQHLKSRFGREDVLVEVYVRDLLRLVLKNTANCKQSNSLSSLYDRLETQLRALESLGVTSDKYAAMLFPLVESCLPEETLVAWERSSAARAQTVEDEVPNRLPLLMKFLHGEVLAEERIRLARTGFHTSPEPRKNAVKKTLAPEVSPGLPTAVGLYSTQQAAVSDSIRLNCVFCDKNHPSFDCLQAKVMPLKLRKDIIVQNRLCFLCLRKGHAARFCSKKFRCPVCNKRHCILLCPREPFSTTENRTTKEAHEQSVVTENALTNQSCPSDVQLQTLKVYLRKPSGDVLIRALIDTGSQRSYILRDLVSGYPKLDEEMITHNLFGGQRSDHRLHARYRIHVRNLKDDYRCNFEVYDQSQICSEIPKIQRGSWTCELSKMGIILSDLTAMPDGRNSEEIQLLIGADVAGKLLTGQVQPLKCGAVAVESRLGWTLMGKLERPSLRTDSTLSAISLLVGEAKIEDLWRLESIGIMDPSEKKSAKEIQEATMQHFRQNICKDTTGRYQVALPWIEGHAPLVSGYFLAERRLLNTVKGLRKRGLLSRYQEVLQDWSNQGIVEEVPLSAPQESFGHYLPHRAVVKESSTTTKIRPVFDASARERNRPSLNSCLEKGPNLIERIVAVLMRFRRHEIGVVSDIRQAFLQIAVKPEDRDYLRFLWCEDGDSDQLKAYRHCRVVFGLTCSPFLLGATIDWHLDQASTDLQETVTLLRDSFYVDNCVASVKSETELQRFIFEAKCLMAAGQFDLRDWVSNLSKDVSDRLTGPHLELVKDSFPVEIPVLGLVWNRYEDTLGYEIKGVPLEDRPMATKRRVLSEVNQIFDPMGLACPVTLLPKLLLQKCWNMNLDWDQELPEDLRRDFEHWRTQVRKMSDIKIPRWLGVNDWEEGTYTFHVFCDASKQAYATCIYVRVETAETISCQLVRACSRVAPLKQLSVPRLELLACFIGARLAESVKSDLHCHEIATSYWTDSTNALCWIRRDEPWAPFMNNRVREIRALTDPTAWHHVAGTLNPADLPSRGCTRLNV